MNMRKKVSISILDATNEPFSFASLAQLNRFLGDEVRFWEKQNKKFGEGGSSEEPHTYFNCANHLIGLKNFIDDQRPRLDDCSDEDLEQIISEITQYAHDNLSAYWLCRKHSFTHTFVECNVEYGLESTHAFVEYAINDSISWGTPLQFLGTMLAYEFFYKDRHIESRREGETRSLENLRSQLFDEIKELGTNVEFNKKRGERQNLEQRTAFEEQMELWKKEVTDLEQLYEEKLHLEKPAEYWSKTAAKHKKHGLAALWSLLVFSSIVLCALGYFFSDWLQGEGFPLSLKTLQGVVLFGSFMAVFAFSIRILARLAFSSFHLMRDAEEREQLTYLYLSLSKTNPAEKESREIILRSLFSRSQTGLLTNETGPSIPAEIVQAQK